MPNPNTGHVNQAAEPDNTPLDQVDDTIEPRMDTNATPSTDKYGNRENKETEGGRPNQEQTRKTRSAKNNDDPQATSARK